jgi:copper chaperone CopZ
MSRSAADVPAISQFGSYASVDPTTPQGYTQCMTELTYTVAGMHCGHCKAAVESEVSQVAGVESVVADLDTKLVVVRGEGLDDRSIRGAIDEAGYEAA